MVSLAFLNLQFGSRRIRPKPLMCSKSENLLYLTGGDFDAKIGPDTNSEETSNSKTVIIDFNNTCKYIQFIVNLMMLRSHKALKLT